MQRVVDFYTAKQLPHGPSSPALGLMVACIAVLLLITLAQAYGFYWLLFS